MQDYLVIYGTLLPEHAPDEIASAVQQLHCVGRAHVLGYLYDLGEYPGAILDDFSHQKVYGQLLSLANDKLILHALDAYEGFKPGDVKGSLFVRRRTAAALDDGRAIQSWIYVYNQDPGTAPLVTGGDYAKLQVA